MHSDKPRRFFLIPPHHFRIDYSINEWMDTNVQIDHELAQRQWQSLVDAYKELGAEVEIFEPFEKLPDQVFLGDAIFLYDDQAIASRFRVSERSAEVDPMIDRFKKKGYTINRLPDNIHFEGNAEAILWDGKILGGFGVRSDLAALEYLGKTLSLEVIPLQVVSPYFHLDIAVCPLNNQCLAYVPAAFEPESLARIEALGADMIAIDETEAKLLACNSMSVNGTVILSTTQVDKFPKALEKAGFNVKALDLTEFAKSGGGAKCLTLEAYQS
ncbi:MAG: arginine deiminase-related protein [Chloroflexi bacterium]|nr:arginine deiminase-related protein [Chloroflexota bacterium]